MFMQLITAQDELDVRSSPLARNREFVTVDTEFIRETTYWPELCLIQIAAPGVTALIDPLSPGIDLAPFFELMANEQVTKVFHAARQDIEIIFNLGGLIPHPVFDTQVAAMVCGFGDSVSYDQLVQKMTGAHLDKSSRFTDWRHRPLSEKQLDYALADVTHLIDVYKHLKAELERENRAPLAERGDGGADLARDLRSASGGRLEAAEDAACASRSSWPSAGRRGMARARGARAQRAARPHRQGRRASTRSRSSSRATRRRWRRLRTTPKGWERSATATALLGRGAAPRSPCPRNSCRSCRARRRRRKARTPPPNC